MLALWSDPQAAVCMAIDAAPGEDNISKWLPRPGATPSQLAREYQSKVQQA
jgi:phosphoribosylformimino-5-aminoimidazole carboxamide ribonucleotide (ProFAR) isomerase